MMELECQATLVTKKDSIPPSNSFGLIAEPARFPLKNKGYRNGRAPFARFIPAGRFTLCSEKGYLDWGRPVRLAGIGCGVFRSPVRSQSQENPDEKVANRLCSARHPCNAGVRPVVLQL